MTRKTKMLIGYAAVVGGLCVIAAVTQPAAAQRVLNNEMDGVMGDLPDRVVLTATLRDFRDTHPDFQAYCCQQTLGLVSPVLGESGLPVLQTARGYTLKSAYRDAEGRPINPPLADDAWGDSEGELVDGGSGNGVSSAASFAQWYTDVPGVNQRFEVPLALERVPGTDRYYFDSDVHEPYASQGGFFPLDGRGFGNYAGWSHNFHFTTVIETEFTYNPVDRPVFLFTGDDDVWVFIGDRLVIDLGGVHGRSEQFLDLSRLEWLEPGAVYPLRIFHAERRTSESNFRMETTLRLRPIEVQAPTMVPFD